MAIAKVKDYSDLSLDFLSHPVTKGVVKMTGPDAVARAIRNLILTNHYDRPFQSYIGSNIQKLLFDNITPQTTALLQQSIEQTITNFEPRADLIGVAVIADPDNNGYKARIAFAVKNRPEPIQIVVFLERVR